jgi:hypothetical protein
MRYTKEARNRRGIDDSTVSLPDHMGPDRSSTLEYKLVDVDTHS